MTLAPGTRFGPYEVAGEIGAGGMGVVYQATDTTLDRDVAIKVLPESMASDAERIARFDREAKTLASLNHPNIAQIYGLERSDGTTALVMELVEGPTLADRIEKGALPADEALGIATQIAEALEAAHGQGIIHRDLKPANIKLRPDGTVKVLDFGIAKALEPENLTTGPQSPMMTTPATMAGVILGTAAYMSPEQARGKPIDQRTDIWAFGCLLYEMLTGQLAFGGEDVAMIMARVIANDTNMDSLPGVISPAVRHTIELCLEKDSSKRIADIRDVKLALKGTFDTGAPAVEGEVAAPAMWPRLAGTVVISLGIAGIAAWSFWPASSAPPAPEPVNRFDYDVPSELQFRRTGRPIMALSRDGRHFLINMTDGLYLRRLGELEARLIVGTEEDLMNPFFSPDGQSVAYRTAGGELKRISISGGAPVIIASDIDNPYGASWPEDGTILLGQNEGIVRVAANGGTPELVFPSAELELLHGPLLLPDGDSVLFSATQTPEWDTAEIVVGSLATGERTVVFRGGSDARYLSSGHLVYAYEDNLFGIAFDLDTLTVSGGPMPLAQGLSRAVADLTAAANYGISDDGSLVYLTGATRSLGNSTLVWTDRAGNETAVGAPLCSCYEVALSPDGTRAAMADLGDNTGGGDLWIWSFEAETRTRLTFEAGFQDAPVWSPDSQRIVYLSSNDGILARAADGTGTIEQLLENTSGGVPPYGLDADGNVIFSVTDQDIHVLKVSGDGSDEPLLANDFTEHRPALSPDGAWIAYESNESGRREIYVRPYPNVDSGKWQISDGGGTQVRWSADGGRLFFLSLTHMMTAEITVEPAFRRQAPEQLFAIDAYFIDVFDRQYDVSADGERFLMIRPGPVGGEAQQAKVIIVQNFVEELSRLVPTE